MFNLSNDYVIHIRFNNPLVYSREEVCAQKWNIKHK